jgi:plasmid stabilization system protein ParE
MNYRLEITDRAAAQLLSQAEWYAEASHSPEIATAWYDGFLAEIAGLEQNPWRGPLAPEANAFAFELREIHYGSGKRLTHRALYRVVGNTVQVLSVRHYAQQPVNPGEL